MGTPRIPPKVGGTDRWFDDSASSLFFSMDLEEAWASLSWLSRSLTVGGVAGRSSAGFLLPPNDGWT